MKKTTAILLLVIAISVIIRIYDLDRGNVVSDEALYGFRAIEYLDFDFALVQPSTLQLFETDIPSWTQLSFHDHPPLVFIVQHWFMKIIGVNLWGLRLPSVLFGIGSVVITFLLGTALFRKRVGIIASLFVGFNVLMLYVSRTAVQESQVIFFILLTVYFFVRAEKNKSWYWAMGAAFGLALLSKYTAIYLIVPLLLYVLIFKRDVFRVKQFYGGLGLILLFMSPVIVYNVLLYKNFGHFDFQISHALGQQVSYWQDTPGKEIGSIYNRFIGFFGNMWKYNFSIFNVLAVGGVVFVAVRAWMTRRKEYILLVLLVLSNAIFYLLIGPAPRFLTMIIPWFAIMIALLFDAGLRIRIKIPRTGIVVVLVCVLALEGLFSVNSYILYRPVGVEGITYSAIHWDMHPWGFNSLDEYLGRIVQDSYPVLTIPYTLEFLEDIKDRSIAVAKGNDLEAKKILFIYNANMSDLAILWTFNRRSLYQAWPILGVENYVRTINEEGEEFYRDGGFTDFYFFQNTDAVLQVLPDRQTEAGEIFEKQLREQDIQPDMILNSDGEEAFRVYHFQ